MVVRSLSLRWFEKATGICSGLDVVVSAVLLFYGAATIDNKLVFLGTHSISWLRMSDGQTPYGERYVLKNLTANAIGPSDKPLFFVCGGKLDFGPKLIRNENAAGGDCHGYWLKDYLFPEESLFSFPAEAGMKLVAGDRDVSDYTGKYAIVVMSVAVLSIILFFAACVAIWLIPCLIVYDPADRYPFVEGHRAKIEKLMDRYYVLLIIPHLWLMFIFLFGPYSAFCEYLIRLALKL